MDLDDDDNNNAGSLYDDCIGFFTAWILVDLLLVLDATATASALLLLLFSLNNDVDPDAANDDDSPSIRTLLPKLEGGGGADIACFNRIRIFRLRMYVFELAAHHRIRRRWFWFVGCRCRVRLAAIVERCRMSLVISRGHVEAVLGCWCCLMMWPRGRKLRLVVASRWPRGRNASWLHTVCDEICYHIA